MNSLNLQTFRHFFWGLLLTLISCSGQIGSIKLANIVGGNIGGNGISFVTQEVIEGNSKIVSFNLTSPASQNLTIEYVISGTNASDDFPTLTNTVLIMAGQQSGTFVIPSNGNLIFDKDRSYQITLTALETGESYSDTFIVKDDESVPVVTFTNATENIVENTSSPYVQLEVSPRSKFPITVTYSVSGSAGAGGVDHNVTSGTITIPALATTFNLPISIVDDAIVEPNETIVLTIDSAGADATIGATNVETISIVDNENVNITISNATATEGGAVTFSVSLSAMPGSPVTFDWQTADNTAIGGVDFTAASATSVTITPPATTATITVNSINDLAVCEGAKTFSVNLLNVSGAIVADGIGTGTINDNDVPTVQFGSATSSVAEGNSGNSTTNIPVTLSAACPTHAITFQAVTANVTATAASDYAAVPLTTYTIPSGTTAYNVPVSIFGNLNYELNETFTLTMSNPTGATLGTPTTHTVTITNDDALPTLSIADVTVAEGTAAGTANVTLTITQSLQSGVGTTVNYATSNGTASQPADYTSTTGTATIGSGGTTTTITVPIVRDSLDEFDESFTVTLSGGSNYDTTGGDLSAIVTITDDDAPPTISIGAVTDQTEGNTITFPVTLSAASGKTITFDFATSAGTATGGTDYTNTSSLGTTISPGTTSVNVTVSTSDDSTVCESTETLTGTISNVANATNGTPLSRTVNILENDIPVITLNSPSGNEGSTFTLTATATISCPFDLTMNYATYPGTAIEVQDYTPVQGSLTIPANTTTSSSDITVITNNDNIPETNEIFIVALHSQNFGTLNGGGNITLIDNEGGTHVAKIAASDNHTCTLTNTGELKCWGSRGKGKLNQKTNIGTVASDMGNALKAVPLGAEPLKVAVGGSHACALLNNQTMKCWGDNTSGRLGLGHTRNVYSLSEFSSNTVDFGTQFPVDICLTQTNSCAILNNGSVKCWGSGNYVPGGTVDIGDQPNEVRNHTPINLNGATAQKIACGKSHACVLTNTNEVKCWGSGTGGKLGQDSTANIGPGVIPSVNLGSMVSPVEISAGQNNSCAIVRDLQDGNKKKLKCWGFGAYGTLGYNNTTDLGDGDLLPLSEMGDNLPFVNFGTSDEVESIWSGYRHSCAKLSSGNYKCWGSGDYVNGIYSSSLTDAGDAPGEMETLPNIGFGAGFTILDITPTSLGGCGLLQNGVNKFIKCWGRNDDAQLGFGASGDRLTSNSSVVDLGTRVPVSLPVTSSMNTTNCIIADNSGTKEVICWGYNSVNTMGTPDYVVGDHPSEMGAGLPVMNLGTDGGSPVVAMDVDTGVAHTCILSTTGKVKCIGAGTSGQIGINTGADRGDDASETLASTPFVTLPAPAIKLAVFGNNSCAILETHDLYCWGDNYAGQLGRGNVSDMRVASLMNFGTRKKVVDVQGGVNPNICAVLAEGTVKCYGNSFNVMLGTSASGFRGDIFAELGDNVPVIDFGVDGSSIPYKVKSLAFADTSGGDPHACAILHDNKVKCWGTNTDGQLGYNSTTMVGATGTIASATALNLGSSVIDLRLTSQHSCALLANGSMKCWGRNTYGQLGYGDTLTRGNTAGSMSSLTAIPFGTGVNVVNMAVASTDIPNPAESGASRTCAVLETNEVKCWGRNFRGLLGYGDEVNRGSNNSEIPELLPEINLNY